MKPVLVLTAVLLSAASAQAELFETRQANGVPAFSDRVVATAAVTRHAIAVTRPLTAAALSGDWRATSHDGRVTTLTLRADGTFVFDQTGARTRVYMCGDWAGGKRAIELSVNALKQQLANGEIEQSAGSFAASATILSGQADRMIVMLRGEKLIFDRS